MENKNSPTTVIAIVLSCFIPGLGQTVLRKFKEGIAIFLCFSTAGLLALWSKELTWMIIPILIWVWNILDVTNAIKGKLKFLPALLWLILAYGIGSQVTEFNLKALVDNASRSKSIVQQMFKLDFIQPKTEKNLIEVNIQAPCSDDPPKVDKTENNLHVSVPQSCGTVNENITILGEGFWPNEEIVLTWRNAIGGVGMAATVIPDAEGKFSFDWLVVPLIHSTAPDPSLPQMHSIKVQQTRPIGGQEISETGGYIIQGIYETLALAFLSTIIGAIFAIPFAFLAARNLMSGNPVTYFFYMIFRAILNITRSIEAMIMAIIFVIIVGLGPFPGMIALTIHTTAALGKLFSEVIEGIDNGQIEAVRATGANWLQVVRFAVIPQVIPQFTGLTIYRWDINIRSSTIIGFVGGGGIGFFLWQWIILQDFSAVGSSFVAIAVVVVILDFFSAKIRERLN